MSWVQIPAKPSCHCWALELPLTLNWSVISCLKCKLLWIKVSAVCDGHDPWHVPGAWGVESRNIHGVVTYSMFWYYIKQTCKDWDITMKGVSYPEATCDELDGSSDNDPSLAAIFFWTYLSMIAWRVFWEVGLEAQFLLYQVWRRWSSESDGSCSCKRIMGFLRGATERC